MTFCTVIRNFGNAHGMILQSQPSHHEAKHSFDSSSCLHVRRARVCTHLHSSRHWTTTHVQGTSGTPTKNYLFWGETSDLGLDVKSCPLTVLFVEPFWFRTPNMLVITSLLTPLTLTCSFEWGSCIHSCAKCQQAAAYTSPHIVIYVISLSTISDNTMSFSMPLSHGPTYINCLPASQFR
jgi:hypothetical protein